VYWEVWDGRFGVLVRQTVRVEFSPVLDPRGVLGGLGWKVWSTCEADSEGGVLPGIRP